MMYSIQYVIYSLRLSQDGQLWIEDCYQDFPKEPSVFNLQSTGLNISFKNNYFLFSWYDHNYFQL